MKTRLLAESLFLLPLGAGSPAQAQTPRDVSDLVGARAPGGESELQRRGYQFVRTQTGDDRKWSNWWRPDLRQCLSVVTMNGRYDSIVSAPAADCGHAEAAIGRDRDRGDRERDDRDGRYHPDIGYRAPEPQVGSSSYVNQGASGGGSEAEVGLVCFGDGQRPQLTTSSGWSWNDKRKRYDHGTESDTYQERFDASIMIQVRPGGGRIRLPSKLVPPLNSGGQDGWWSLYDVSMSPDTIDASYRLNMLNKPRMTIDRHSGHISIEGSADYAFSGRCDVAGQEERRF